MRYKRVDGARLLECEFCTGALDSSLTCVEPDCFADMHHHWSMTCEAKLQRALLLAKIGTFFVEVDAEEEMLDHFLNSAA